MIHGHYRAPFSDHGSRRYVAAGLWGDYVNGEPRRHRAYHNENGRYAYGQGFPRPASNDEAG